MIKKIAISLVALTLSVISFSQEPTDSIIVKTNFWTGTKFFVNGNTLTTAEAENVIKANAEAYSYFKKAKTSTVFSNIIAGVGGALIGYPIGVAAAGGDAPWILAGIGAGVIVADIPLIINSNKKFQKAIDIYNTSISSNSQSFRYDLHMEVKNGGLALVLRF